MNTISKQVLIAIMELSICQGKRVIKTPWEGLRLRTALRTSENDLLTQALDDLRDNEKDIERWSIQEPLVEIVIAESKKVPAPDSMSDREVICDRAIERALLHRLYEEYRNTGQRHLHYPLAGLSEALESSKDEIYRLVQVLQDSYYLEYKVMDGGMCSSDITFDGIKLCEIKTDLFKTLGTLQIVSKESNNEKNDADADPRKVFVVHGRNEHARKAMFSFLRSIGLDPIEWSEATSYTGKGTPYIGEILDHAFHIAKAVVVLITGDDIAKLGNQYIKEDDPSYERVFMPQARPNVLFEAGLAFGRRPERTILVEFDANRPFSDISGLHVLKIDNDAKSRQDLAMRLKTAGCDVKIDGKTDWLTEGDFEEAMKSQSIRMNAELNSFSSNNNADPQVSRQPDGTMLDILSFIVEHEDSGFVPEQLSKHFQIQIVKMQYYLDILVKSEHLYPVTSLGGPSIYKLTEKGRAFIVEYLESVNADK